MLNLLHASLAPLNGFNISNPLSCSICTAASQLSSPIAPSLLNTSVSELLSSSNMNSFFESCIFIFPSSNSFISISSATNTCSFGTIASLPCFLILSIASYILARVLFSLGSLLLVNIMMCLNMLLYPSSAYTTSTCSLLLSEVSFMCVSSDSNTYPSSGAYSSEINLSFVLSLDSNRTLSSSKLFMFL